VKEVLVVIPARYASSRYPGKPLVPILGTPMVIRVARIAAAAVGVDSVVVATEDARIAEVVAAAGFRAVMTSDRCLTGTDRLAEVAEQVDAAVYVNVQGDEPILDPASIQAVIEQKRLHPTCVINAMAPIASSEDPGSVNIPKVVANEDGLMLYMSRNAVPGFKDPLLAPVQYWKQVCIYAFTRGELRAFSAFGRKSVIENSEDIEILRFLELGIQVRMLEVAGGSLAVDVPDDVARVEQALTAASLA